MLNFKQFKAKCPECKEKDVFLLGPDDVRFCSRICETNYQYRNKHKDAMSGNVPGVKEVRKWK